MANTFNTTVCVTTTTPVSSKSNSGLRDGGLVTSGRARFEQQAFGFRPAEKASSSTSEHDERQHSPIHPNRENNGNHPNSLHNSNYSYFDDGDETSGNTHKSHTSAGHQNNGSNSDGRSAYSYNSDTDAHRFLRRMGGRTFNTLNETYFMPADEEEWARLNKQHISIVLGLGGLYPAPDIVEAVLAPVPGIRKRILDLGSGTGIWAIEMARRFPTCDVVGVDLSPIPLDTTTECLPPNCQFEIDDIELGLCHFHNPQNQFDLIHARFIGAGLKDFRATMQEVEKCLRPGGMVIWMDSDYDLYRPRNGNGGAKDGDAYEYVPFAVEGSTAASAVSGRSWLSRMLYETKRAAAVTGQSDLDGMSRALDEGLWSHPSMDPETCKTASLYMPIGPWATHDDFGLSQQLKYAGALLRQDLLEVNRATRNLLIRAGHHPQTLNDWLRRADEELVTMNPRMLSRFRIAWGRKSSNPIPSPSHNSSLSNRIRLSYSTARQASLPQSPPRPQPQTGDDSCPRSPTHQYQYPYLFTYHTQGQSLAATALRNRNKNISAPPFP